MRKFLPLIIIGIACIFRVYIHCHSNWESCKKPKLSNTSTLPVLSMIREESANNIKRHIPSPHAELLMGITLGIDELKNVPKFNAALKDTGTVHVVVVSGYNITLVFDIIIKIIGTKYKLRNLLLAQSATLFYSLLSGFEPPVIRAWVMGSIVSWGKYYGRSLQSLLVLVFSAEAMILYNPLYFFSLSFQLSFLATLSLILYSEFFAALKNLAEDFATSISAQVLVWPFISYYFGRIILLSFVVNGLVLWTIPLGTILGFLLVGGSFISHTLSNIIYFLIMPVLDFFVEGVMYFSKYQSYILDYKMSLNYLIIYYIVALGICLISNYYHKIMVHPSNA